MTQNHKAAADVNPAQEALARSQMELGSKALLEMQRRNLQALNSLAQLTADGFQAIARHQTVLFNRAVDEAWGVMRASTKPQTPPEHLMAHLEAAKRSLIGTSPAAQELVAILTQVQQNACDIVRHRLAESVDEVRDLFPAKAAE